MMPVILSELGVFGCLRPFLDVNNLTCAQRRKPHWMVRQDDISRNNSYCNLRQLCVVTLGSWSQRAQTMRLQCTRFTD